MLNVILSHWLMYVFVVYVLVLIVACVAFPPRIRQAGLKLLRYRSHSRMITSRLRMRPLR